jgi:hypothetical protein
VWALPAVVEWAEAARTEGLTVARYET